jgi:hypothetical protein
MIRRPCLDCGTLTSNATRCEPCRLARQRARVRGPRPHYGGDYARRAKLVRQAPGPCWICGRDTLEPGDIWTADHLLPGDPASPLAKAHRSCNSSRGATPLPPA